MGDDRTKQYQVTICTKDGCHHPGGQHRLAHGELPARCRLCDCDGWDEASTVPGYWSDAHTADAEEAQMRSRRGW